jgi:hypothetical protein
LPGSTDLTGASSREFLTEQDLVAMVLQALAIRPALDFGRVVERVFDRSEADDQILGALLPDSGRARNVVDGIAL